MGKILLMAAVLAGFVVADRCAHSQKTAAEKAGGKEVKEFAMVNLEYEGTKIWLPSLLVVKKGDRVRIKLINNVPSGEHGFAITEFNVVDKVFKGETRSVEFTADKAGIYKIFCQIHPAHIGAQLMVVD